MSIGTTAPHCKYVANFGDRTLGLSQITIRKDLNYLQSKDPLVRTHGGGPYPARLFLREARVNRAMVKAAKKVVAVCDSSKFNRRSLSLIVGTASVDQVITDSKFPPEEVKAIQDAALKRPLSRCSDRPHEILFRRLCISD